MSETQTKDPPEWAEHNAAIRHEAALDEAWRELRYDLERAISTLTALGLTPEQISDGIDESRFQAWSVLPSEGPECICPPELVARGGFKGGCPVHGSI